VEFKCSLHLFPVGSPSEFKVNKWSPYFLAPGSRVCRFGLVSLLNFHEILLNPAEGQPSGIECLSRGN
jgi:hypothetical protein